MADFFDKVKEGISKGVSTVSIKSKEMLEANKIKGEIDNLQREKKADLEELGSTIYTMFREGKNYNEGIIQEKCEALLKIDSRIEEKEKELERVHQEAQEALTRQKSSSSLCTCGAEILPNAKFCGKCGKKMEDIEVQKEEPKAQGKLCPGCGASMSLDAKFCGKCGTKL